MGGVKADKEKPGIPVHSIAPNVLKFRQCAILTSFADFVPGMIPLPETFFRNGGAPYLLAKEKIGITPFR